MSEVWKEAHALLEELLDRSKDILWVEDKKNDKGWTIYSGTVKLKSGDATVLLVNPNIENVNVDGTVTVNAMIVRLPLRHADTLFTAAREFFRQRQ